ncbi:YbfB/YjiJ family MFS transporter [Paraburkholderia sp. DHOC27]|uniref:YbfB/YjiJ family MFS transporter n=1 Tax=Paraburkholderia sp. DHOC27 TaxID=2303330 RepID=UPI000E3C3996|nr:YbfB/YjiJ family MFS transporter [Paraburkholderia sp. DHOC27]RFU46455.1 YbfB/YjiJ family MFS transporter [Paraburkholderia sp. DHOC27]
MVPLARTSSISGRPAQHAAFACAVALAVALGVGRFAFTPLLPLMLKGGALDIRHGGWLASANYAGYLVGALSCGALRFDHARVVRFGLAATVALTLAMGVVDLYWMWAAIRFAAGVVSAWAFVFASQWGLRRLAELDAHSLAGMIYAGPGVGIIATGLLGAAAAAHDVAAPFVWIGFALCSAVAVVFVWNNFAHELPAVRGRAQLAEPTATASTRTNAAWLIGLYSLAGFGYIITATFLPVIAREALPGSPWPDLFWPVFGLALMVGALVGARLPITWDNRLLLAACYVIQALGILLGIVFPTALGLGLGSMLLGLPFTAITLFAMREARRLRGESAAGLMGYATGAYGFGQIAGPLVAAPIAAHTGSFSLALWIAVAALSFGALALAWLGTRKAAAASLS